MKHTSPYPAVQLLDAGVIDFGGKAWTMVTGVPGHQRIYVVSTATNEADLRQTRGDLGRTPVVVTAPTAEAKRVVHTLGVKPQVEVLLAPTSFPPANRGHQLDALIRQHALRDRFRDVVVVTDPATSTLLLRVLAPDQLSSGGSVTVVGLPRGDRPVAVRRALASGSVLGVVASVAEPLPPILVLPAVAALLGLVLLLLGPIRHLGRELLLVAPVAAVVALLIVAGSARFPGAW